MNSRGVERLAAIVLAVTAQICVMAPYHAGRAERGRDRENCRDNRGDRQASCCPSTAAWPFWRRLESSRTPSSSIRFSNCGS